MSLIDAVADTHFANPTDLIPMNNAASSAANSSANTVPDIPATFTQTERLLTVRSRSINHLTGGGDRGERAYITVLTTNPTNSLNRTGEGHDATPTSLRSGEDVLNQAVNGAGKYGGYASFLLTDVQCSLDEKLQVIETMGDAEVSYYFGRQPVMFNFSGILVDSPDNNWFIQWLEMYSHVMRGSQLARNYELLEIVLPNMTLTGTMTRMGWAQNSARDTDIPFQFSFLAKRIVPIPVTVNSTPLTNSSVIDWDKAKDFLDQAGINGTKNIASAESKLSSLQSVIADPTSTSKDYSNAIGALGSGMTGVDPALDYAGGDITKFGVPASTSADDSGFFNSVGSTVTDAKTSLGNLFGGITANLSGIRASLFSPVYGVLSSLTKLIKSVTGTISGVTGGFTQPIRDILRDVRNISNEAIGVVNMITNSVNSLTSASNSLNADILTTVSLLKKTAGVITTMPENLKQAVSRLVSSGKLPLTAGFLQTKDYKTLPSGVRTNVKLALLSSGPKHTPEQGAKL